MFAGVEQHGRVCIDPRADQHQQHAVRLLLESYLSIESAVMEKIAMLKKEQEKHMRSIAGLSLKTTIRTDEKSDKCIIYAPGKGFRYDRAVHNLYLDYTDGVTSIDVDFLGPPGPIQRYRLRKDGWRHASDVYYIENMSRKLSTNDILKYAIQEFQQEYDKRKPMVAAQRPIVRAMMRYRPAEVLEDEPKEMRWRDLLLDYLSTPVIQQP
jgi:hypothetical protein